ncbi:PH domain-containing protein [Streptosporangium amethystogenes subsp. fukuiense]|uniref:PH domain-containing protein n=1 Tax=Streptosporangium amethystogenes subsp. fukuiense TaxID=698418 RepID=A0ABW2TAI9_9ACTN
MSTTRSADEPLRTDPPPPATPPPTAKVAAEKAPAEAVEVVDDGVGWQRLSSRVAWVDGLRFVLSLIPSFLTMFVFDRGFDAWPVLIITVIGTTVSILNLRRWLTTRYRLTVDRVEIRRGVLVRRYRSVPRDRIRTVDTTAKFRHRIAGLRVLHIASGEARTSFKLDAIPKKAAEELRDELLRDRGSADPSEDVNPENDHPAPQETVIARLSWSWVPYNVISIWSFLVAGLFLVSAGLTLQMFDVDLWEVIGNAVGWEDLGLGWSIAVGATGCFVVGTIGLTITFFKEKWNFELVRTTTDDGGTALLTRQGLFNTREVYRDDRRLRGVHISEPLLSRWMGLAETEVISTGLRWIPGSDASSSILPRAPIGEARRVAVLVLGDEHRPLEAKLRAHPRAALYRRLIWALYVPGIVAGLLAWLGATGAVPERIWLVLVALMPLTCLLAFVAYRSLGHTLAGPYLVMRSGVVRRNTVVLQCRGVIGWTLSQSLLQRALGLMTIRVSTAAGARSYEIPDVAADQAVTFAHGGTPELVSEFLVNDNPSS